MGGEKLASVLDEGARRVLAWDGDDQGSDDHPYSVVMRTANEIVDQVMSVDDQPGAGHAYVLLMWISDLVDDPRGPLSWELCEITAHRYATEWLALDNRSDLVQLNAFVLRWKLNLRAIGEGDLSSLD